MDLHAILTGIILITLSGLSVSFCNSIVNNSSMILKIGQGATKSTFLNQSGILPVNETVITNSTSTVVSNNTTINNNSTLLSNGTIEVATNISNVTYTNVTSYLNITTPIPSITNITTTKPDISTNTFNSHVSLHLSYNNEFLCGGVILDSRFIVTVANCMYYNWGGILPPIIVTVSAGRKKLSVEPVSQYQVEEISFHNAYQETTSAYDIALIKIKTSIAFSDRIDRISLPKPQIKYKQCTITGWNKISSELDALTVELVRCSPAQISEEVICAQTTVSNYSLCNLSKGSSLICGDGLFGILSNEPSCKSNNQVGVFQNLEKSTKWLKQTGVNGVSYSLGTITHFPMWMTMILVVSIISC